MVCREVASATKLTCMGEVSQSFAQCNYDTIEEYENILIGKTVNYLRVRVVWEQD